MTKILITEDDRAMQHIFIEILKIDGYDTMTAGDGEKAIELLHSYRPDILMLDLYLPKLSGYAVIEHIKLSGIYNDMKTIIVTANNNVLNRPEAEWADIVMLKPISMTHLRQIMKRLISPVA